MSVQKPDFTKEEREFLDLLKKEADKLVEEIVKEPFYIINYILNKVRVTNEKGNFVIENGHFTEDWNRLSTLDLQELLFKLGAYNVSLMSASADTTVEHKFAKLLSEDEYFTKLSLSQGRDVEERKALAKLESPKRYLVFFKECVKERVQKTVDAFDKMYSVCSRIATLRSVEIEKFRE